jgi:hypothetical protein
MWDLESSAGWSDLGCHFSLHLSLRKASAGAGYCLGSRMECVCGGMRSLPLQYARCVPTSDAGLLRLA